MQQLLIVPFSIVQGISSDTIHKDSSGGLYKKKISEDLKGQYHEIDIL